MGVVARKAVRAKNDLWSCFERVEYLKMSLHQHSHDVPEVPALYWLSASHLYV
jgi:hypothetical protein